MHESWIKAYNLQSEVNFGSLKDRNALKQFSLEDSKLKKTISILKMYIENSKTHTSILIGGDAGVGKSTLVQYLKEEELDRKKIEVFIINAENKLGQKHLVKEIVESIEKYYSRIIILLTEDGRRSLNSIQKKIENVIAEMYYDEPEERINSLCRLYDEMWQTKQQLLSNVIPELILILDQVDTFDGSDVIAKVSSCFAPILGSSMIKSIVCARTNTIELAKSSGNNYWSTNFQRKVEVPWIPIEYVLQKRINTASYISIIQKNIYKCLPERFCSFLRRTQNNNIRTSLAIIEELMISCDATSGQGTTRKYTDFLIRQNHLSNLYKHINPNDTLPLIRIVFEALSQYSIVDDYFISKVKLKIYSLGVKVEVLNENTIRAAVQFLTTHSLIIQTFDFDNHYKYTEKGKEYYKLLFTTIYQQYFCTHESFLNPIFNDSDFSTQ